MWMGLVGYESVFSDYLVSGDAVRLGASAPDVVEFRDGLYLPGFDGAGVTVEEAHLTIHILHDIRPGSTPTFHIHWTHNNATPTGDVKWQIDYSLAKGYSAGTFPAPTTVTTTQTAGAQYTHHITNDDDMPLTGDFEPDAIVMARIYRDPADAADTFGDDAFLVHVDMHYEISAFGTEDRNRPFDHY